MAQDATIGELLDALDIAPTIGGRAAGARARAGEAPGRAGAEFGLHIVADLKRLLRTNPSLMMSTAPALLGQRPTVAQAAALLDDGEMALNRADVTLRQVRANREGASFELPPEHQFEGYDTTEIPIQPGLTRFEDLVDAPASALTAIEAWAFRL